MTIMSVVVVQWLSGCCCGWPSLPDYSGRRTRASSNSLIILAALLVIMCSSQLIAEVSEVRFSDPRAAIAQHLVQQPHVVALASNSSSSSSSSSSSALSAIGDVASAAATRPHRRSRRHCPSCRLPLTPIHRKETEGEEEEEEEEGKRSVPLDVAAQQQHQAIGESARLESIKRQILIKLGLNAKPNLLSSVIPPRDFILETLLRAEESSSSRPHQSQSSHQGKQGQQPHPHHSQADGSVDNVIVDDDFYGKTSEIIAFGEPGPRLNGQVLAEFSRVQETAPESSLRVKSATLWIYVQLNGSLIAPHPTRADRHVHQQQQQQQQQQQRTSRSPTLYVFRLLSSPEAMTNASSSSSSSSSDKNWNELLLASQKVTIQHSGWMKINISEGVQKWFGTASASSGSNNKLRLLVDCSGCGSNVQPVLFVVPQSSSSSSSSSSQSMVDATQADGNAQQTSNKNKKKKRKKRRKRKRRLVEEEEEEEKQQKEDDRKEQQQQQQVQHRPFIVIHTDSSSSRRLRRRTPLDCSPTTSACCKQRFFVSFRALGWDDWIIAPSGYYANYCRGDCGGGGTGAGGGARAPESFLSYHSHVIDQVRKQLPLALTHTTTTNNNNNKKKSKKKKLLAEQQQQMLANYLQPCCAPTKFSSMSLIYFGPDMNIIKRDLPKMVVDECGCP